MSNDQPRTCERAVALGLAEAPLADFQDTTGTGMACWYQVYLPGSLPPGTRPCGDNVHVCNLTNHPVWVTVHPKTYALGFSKAELANGWASGDWEAPRGFSAAGESGQGPCCFCGIPQYEDWSWHNYSYTFRVYPEKITRLETHYSYSNGTPVPYQEWITRRDSYAFNVWSSSLKWGECAAQSYWSYEVGNFSEAPFPADCELDGLCTPVPTPTTDPNWQPSTPYPTPVF